VKEMDKRKREGGEGERKKKRREGACLSS